MRGFGRFSERKLTQISLQTATLVEISIIYTRFSATAGSVATQTPLYHGVSFVTIRFRFLLQQRQRVVGCHNGRMLVLTGQFDLYE